MCITLFRDSKQILSLSSLDTQEVAVVVEDAEVAVEVDGRDGSRSYHSTLRLKCLTTYEPLGVQSRVEYHSPQQIFFYTCDSATIKFLSLGFLLSS